MKCHFDDNLECKVEECYAECPHHPYKDLLKEEEQRKKVEVSKKLEIQKSKEPKVEGILIKAIRVVFATIIASFIPVLFLIMLSGAVLEAGDFIGYMFISWLISLVVLTIYTYFVLVEAKGEKL